MTIASLRSQTFPNMSSLTGKEKKSDIWGKKVNPGLIDLVQAKSHRVIQNCRGALKTYFYLGGLIFTSVK